MIESVITLLVVIGALYTQYRAVRECERHLSYVYAAFLLFGYIPILGWIPITMMMPYVSEAKKRRREYLKAHPPPTPEEIARRAAEQRRRREESRRNWLAFNADLLDALGPPSGEVPDIPDGLWRDYDEE